MSTDLFLPNFTTTLTMTARLGYCSTKYKSTLEIIMPNKMKTQFGFPNLEHSTGSCKLAVQKTYLI